MVKRRKPLMTGVLGIFIILIATLAAFSFKTLPFIGAGPTYKAEFSEAAGLKKGSEVRVAGVKVGNVESVSLDGNKVLVSFRVQDTWIGDQTRASIQIKTILGDKYLALDPQGTSLLDSSDPIPLNHTTSPYDVIEAFSDASKSLDKLDTAQLAQSFQVLSDSFAGTPADIHDALTGITRLSNTVASRDADLRKLFAATTDTSKILADRNKEFVDLLDKGGQLLDELNNRQRSISALLTGTEHLSQQLSGLVKDNEQQIGPALTQLQAVVDILKKNQANIDKAMVYGAPFYRLFNNSLGTGRWWDTTVTNLTPPALPQIPGNRPPIRDLGGN
ncbi:MCE family protein [Speluncibacter jeojiensis]|uniref:MCE family protein n=1 Tax=Speluncibacter jeojiensis TaxID=2710754 RepID=A0A9X4REU0_9ACTN|nr:MCE family protein [Corynebacteriales bacterium D3-21]